MSIELIIAAATTAINSIIKLVGTLGEQLSKEDYAKLKLGVLNSINQRTKELAEDKAAEWSKVDERH